MSASDTSRPTTIGAGIPLSLHTRGGVGAHHDRAGLDLGQNTDLNSSFPCRPPLNAVRIDVQLLGENIIPAATPRRLKQSLSAHPAAA
jgi:hypothetical protein